MLLLRTMALGLLATAVCACNRKVAGGSVNGKEVFAAACASCHGETGKPTASMTAQLGVRDLTADEFRKRVTPELVHKQVSDGSENRIMPSFREALSPEQIDAVSDWVASGMK